MAFIRIGRHRFNTDYLKRDPLLPAETFDLYGQAAEDFERYLESIGVVDWTAKVAGRAPGSKPRDDRGVR